MRVKVRQAAVQAVLNVIAQGGPCQTPNGRCTYKEGDKACVVGHMIDPTLRGGLKFAGSIYDDQVRGALEATLGEPLTAEELATLASLQRWHDTNAMPTLDALQKQIATLRATANLTMEGIRQLSSIANSLSMILPGAKNAQT